ncbi:MAG TPA: hypothetical protein VN695_15190 [Streptosporangiaceae bacterium]|nr:hypothetical protein [Streptosporangiaceae bacterium]
MPGWRSWAVLGAGVGGGAAVGVGQGQAPGGAWCCGEAVGEVAAGLGVDAAEPGDLSWAVGGAEPGGQRQGQVHRPAQTRHTTHAARAAAARWPGARGRRERPGVTGVRVTGWGRDEGLRVAAVEQGGVHRRAELVQGAFGAGVLDRAGDRGESLVADRQIRLNFRPPSP